MLLSTRALWSLLLTASSYVQAQYLANELSFGYDGRVTNPVSNFRIIGEANPPQVLSTKIILTPPAPGNQRGAAWAEKPLQHTEWTGDVFFRATGPERGSAKLAIWLVKDGERDLGLSSIYTVGKFDGLALTIDTYDGTGGMIRGFLNDGSTDYKSHHSVDSLAFGHCAYSYRNLGRPSQIKLRQDKSMFKVEVDGSTCFETSNVRLPTGYFFGFTAVSAEMPDSVEVYKFVVTTDSPFPVDASQSAGQPEQQRNDAPPVSLNMDSLNDPADLPAEAIEQARQFADVHNRLQAVFRHIGSVQRDLKHFEQRQTERHQELLGARTFPFDQFNAMDRRLDAMEKAINQIRLDVSDKDYVKLHAELKKTLQDSHTNLLEGMVGSVGHAISSSAPRLGFFIFIIIGSQMLLALSYVLYKRRRLMAPKKYL
ncbi:MAG: hypothetical protein M1818_003771 [Claussenomyces sp. TS43310]|nr:MAG: hypothetical protein M1818_003771 [Claussenomyces sp. TS43310]